METTQQKPDTSDVDHADAEDDTSCHELNKKISRGMFQPVWVNQWTCFWEKHVHIISPIGSMYDMYGIYIYICIYANMTGVYWW